MSKPRRWLPTLLLILGGLLLFWATLVSVKPLLSNYQLVEGEYLLFPQQVNLPLPKIGSIRSTEPAPQDVFHSLVYNPYTPTPTVTPTPTPVPAGPASESTGPWCLCANIGMPAASSSTIQTRSLPPAAVWTWLAKP